MTAEGKLKNRYLLLKRQGGWNSKDNVLMSPYDIDLIVDLVVERIKAELYEFKYIKETHVSKAKTTEAGTEAT